MDRNDLIPWLRVGFVKLDELMRGGLGGLGDLPARIHQPVEALIIQVHILQEGFFAKDDVDRDHLDVVFFFP